MKPRRENGAGMVNPITSDVSVVSALISLSPRLIEGRNQRKIVSETQITSLRGMAEKNARSRGNERKQGHRRSMPPATLPAPEIEIGSRLPVASRVSRIRAGDCEAVHIAPKKLWSGQAGSRQRVIRATF